MPFATTPPGSRFTLEWQVVRGSFTSFWSRFALQTKTWCVWTSYRQKGCGVCRWSEHASQGEVWCPATYWGLAAVDWSWILVWQVNTFNEKFCHLKGYRPWTMTPYRFISFSNSKCTLEKRTWSQPPLEINSYKAQEASSYFGGNVSCVHMVS